jgi:hypothetical protein
MPAAESRELEGSDITLMQLLSMGRLNIARPDMRNNRH